MGVLLTKLMKKALVFNGPDFRILMLGLDAAGKTTILYKVKLDEDVITLPTLGFNVETVTPIKGIRFTVWDVGGQDKIRPLWRHYFQDTNGLFFVVDSADRERLIEASDELTAIFENGHMKNCPLVVIANKQDLPNAMSPDEIIDGLNLRQLEHSKWHVQGACALNADGIYEAMEIMAKYVKSKGK